MRKLLTYWAPITCSTNTRATRHSNVSGGGDINNPTHLAVVGDKIGYYNKDWVQSEGAFAQAEYSKGILPRLLLCRGRKMARKGQIISII